MFMYACICQEPSSLFICAGFAPPQEQMGMNADRGKARLGIYLC